MRKVKSIIPLIIVAIFSITAIGWLSKLPVEGMYPLSEISKLDLVSAGLKINPDEVYNPNGTSLIDALVNIRGCTGSFVSENGLILTNHHCGFGYVSKASTLEHNYLKDGFLAKSYEDEIPAEGNYCKITESYEDVSDIILSSIKEIKNAKERAQAIDKKMKALGEEASDKVNNIEAQVSEMFIGKTYILFKYRVIKDVRLVYVPPITIGNFGGESDNWVWPRHTGDFTFMRAYVAPDGNAAEYSKDNVPYTPKKWLKINPNGVKEEDFVFVLGYPGRTFRNMPAKYYEYKQNFVLPYISNLYDWLISQSQDISRGNEELELKFASPIKSWANTMKKYKGQLKGFRTLGLVEKKQNEEKELIDFINSDNELKDKYGQLFTQLNATYADLEIIAQKDLWFQELFRYPRLIKSANYILEYTEEIKKDDANRKEDYKEKNLEKTFESLLKGFKSTELELEKRFLVKMISDARGFEETSKIDAVEEILEKDLDKYVTANLLDSNFLNEEFIKKLSDMTPSELDKMDIPLLNFTKELIAQRSIVKNEADRIDGTLNLLLAQLLDLKMEKNKTSFVPDANSTFRLTYGYIKGYSPADAVYYSPFTNVEGILEKNLLGTEDYELNDSYKELLKRKEYGKFYDSKLKSVPVALLYNTDTTGGNSGSPVLNAYGELIGLNYDRAFEATINDYTWDNAFSRSIGVDIRYILWVAQKYSGADHLLKEMNIN